MKLFKCVREMGSNPNMFHFMERPVAMCVGWVLKISKKLDWNVKKARIFDRFTNSEYSNFTTVVTELTSTQLEHNFFFISRLA